MRTTSSRALLAYLALTQCAFADSDYYLSAPTQTLMQADLQQLGLLNSPWSAGFSPGFGPSNYAWAGQCSQGGSWRLRVLGQLNSPAPQVSIQPREPGNFTNRAGQAVWPPFVVNPLNPKVGIQSIPDTAPAFWVFISWNCNSPLPNFTGLGLKQQRANDRGIQGGPFGPHF